MEKQATGKGMAKSMGHLVRLLHREWERSGRTEAEAAVKMDDAVAVKKSMAEAILERQKQLDAGEMDLEQSMALSQENFVLLRLIKKFKSAEEKMEGRGTEAMLTVELDREEYRLFMDITGPQAR